MVEAGRGRFAVAAAENSTHPGLEFGERERLDDEVVGAPG